MQNFELRNPTKLIFGRDTIGRIGDEIRRGGHRKVLLLAGGGSIRSNGVHDTVVASLRQAGVEWAELWGVQPNPVLEKINEAVAAARGFGAEAILAVGGGSVIDSAKIAAAGMAIEADPWSLFERREATGQGVTAAAPVYVVQTLSATGSEMNCIAVLTNAPQKKKWGLAGPAMYPVVSILDPSVQASLPWNQTVNGALDAMAHILEFYFMAEGAEATLAMGESLVRTIVHATDRLQADPGDYDARASLAWAAVLAMNGVCGAGSDRGDWASHAIEQAASAEDPNVAHGAGLGVLLPAWIEYCRRQELRPSIFRRWAREIWRADDIAGGIAAMKEKIRCWGGATALRDLGVAEALLPAIAANAASRRSFRGNLKPLEEAEMLDILKIAY